MALIHGIHDYLACHGGGLIAKSCLTLWDPVDCSLLGSSVHGIFLARILEWVATSFCRGSSQVGTELWSPALQADSLPTKPPGKPNYLAYVHIYFDFEPLRHSEGRDGREVHMPLCVQWSWVENSKQPLQLVCPIQ